MRRVVALAAATLVACTYGAEPAVPAPQLFFGFSEDAPKW